MIKSLQSIVSRLQLNKASKAGLFVFLLLLICMLVDHRHFFDIPRRLEDRPLIYQLVFYINYLGLLLSCLVYFTIKSKLIRIVFSLLFFISVSITFAMEIAHGNVFSRMEANLMFTETQFAGEAFKAFFYQYLQAISFGLIITVILAFVAFRFMPKIDNIYALFPIVFIAISFKINFASNSWHTLFPSVFNVPIVAADAYITIPRFGPRKLPFIKPENKGLFKHIIWIVDESIRGDLLSINQSPIATTPYLESIKTNYYNYGIMSSSSHYSYGSNMVFQSGLRLDQLPDSNLNFGTNPNIFQYSKQAGYKTYFIDGQNKEEIPTNGMTHYDFEHIDHYIRIHKLNPKMKWPEVDSTIVNQLKKVMESDENTFTYINKAGCHFAYNNFYPKNRELFKPSYRGGEAWTDSATLRNTYCNCINWNVDEFFRKLYPSTIDKNAIIIYTSDHGVSLLEQGRPVQDIGPLNPLPARATVPFLVFAGKQQPELFHFAKVNKNRLSHFSIFPGILLLLGYNETQIIQNYGEGFFTKNEKSKRFFFSGSIYDPQNFYLNGF
jgi:glucan phosphoethanolaminetransferase (alkaline phosphatase superfamily)